MAQWTCANAPPPPLPPTTAVSRRAYIVHIRWPTNPRDVATQSHRQWRPARRLARRRPHVQVQATRMRSQAQIQAGEVRLGTRCGGPLGKAREHERAAGRLCHSPRVMVCLYATRELLCCRLPGRADRDDACFAGVAGLGLVVACCIVAMGAGSNLRRTELAAEERPERASEREGSHRVRGR